VLSGLHEQLNVPQAQQIVEVVEHGSDDRTLMSAFKSQLAELDKLTVEVGSSLCAWMVLREAASSTCFHTARHSVCLLWPGAATSGVDASRMLLGLRAREFQVRCGLQGAST
jgi:hypothetical protein